MKEELKTLKDIFKITCKTPEQCLTTHEKIRRAEADRIEQKIRMVGNSWNKFISNGMKTVDDLMFQKLTGNTLTYDEKIRECICVFIKHFFNITEENLK